MNDTAQPHFLSTNDIDGLDMAEIFMEAKSVISETSSVEIEGWGTYTYQDLEIELSNMGY